MRVGGVVKRLSVELFMLFFFFKQKTAYELSSRDWSSDVCSSDLLALVPHPVDDEVSLRTRRGDALANADRGAPAAEAYLAAAALRSGDDALELRRRAAEQLLRSGHLDEGLGVMNAVLREVGLPAVTRRRWPVASLLAQRVLLRVRRWRGPARREGSDDDRR